MKKSPLSTPSGSRGNNGYDRRSHDRKHATGYSSLKSDSYQCISPNGARIHRGDDFIPLNISTPVTEPKRSTGNWHGPAGNRSYRNSSNGGHNHYRSNYHATPKSSFNSSYSPYKYSGKQFHGQKKAHHKDAQKCINISSYVDYKSFLEDPWAELAKKLNKSEDANLERSPKCEQSLSVQSVHANSCFSEGSKTESPNATGLDGTDVGGSSQARSSIDSKLDEARFSGGDVAREAVRKENVRRSCETQS